MTRTKTDRWKSKQTDESRFVEVELRKAGFQQVDAYRFNSASIRVRVIDPRFDGLSQAKRDALVEKHIMKLPDDIRGDILSLFTFSPTEIAKSPAPVEVLLFNTEFENPRPSRL
jgi:acid stress-induced BolA-like protein IbaG/YrbA